MVWAGKMKEEAGMVAPKRSEGERSEPECDWHGQEIGGERQQAQVLSRSPDEGNPTPM
jgi:hypothetical protein